MWLVKIFFLIIFLMWNEMSIVKNDENHDELKFSIWKKNYIGKFLMHFTIKLFILWCPILYF